VIIYPRFQLGTNTSLGTTERTDLVIIYPRFQLRLWQVISLDVDFNKLTARDWPTTAHEITYNKWNYVILVTVKITLKAQLDNIIYIQF